MSMSQLTASQTPTGATLVGPTGQTARVTEPRLKNWNNSTNSPYRGLSEYTELDHDVFFGREEIATTLAHTIISRFDEPHLRSHRMLTLVGPPGSGKSSLIRAGVLPELVLADIPQAASFSISIARPNFHPLEELAAAVVGLLDKNGSELGFLERREIASRLVGDSEKMRSALQHTSSRNILIIDQLEELWLRPELLDDVKRHFLSSLLDLSEDRTINTVVITVVRSDFLGALLRYPRVAQAIEGDIWVVGDMTISQLHRIITEPALRAGSPLQPEVVDHLLKEALSTAYPLPLLQDFLVHFWAMRSQGTSDLELLHRIGGPGELIVATAERAFYQFDPTQQNIARRLLLQLVSAGDGPDFFSRKKILDIELPHDFGTEYVIRRLLEHRVLTSDVDAAGERYYMLATEALTARWPRLRAWIADSREDLFLLRRANTAAEAWLSNGRHVENLWTLPDWIQLAQLEQRDPDLMPIALREFLAESRNAWIGPAIVPRSLTGAEEFLSQVFGRLSPLRRFQRVLGQLTPYIALLAGLAMTNALEFLPNRLINIIGAVVAVSPALAAETGTASGLIKDAIFPLVFLALFVGLGVVTVRDEFFSAKPRPISKDLNRAFLGFLLGSLKGYIP